MSHIYLLLMGRINARVDDDLLDEVDSHGDVRSQVVRDALKEYLNTERGRDTDGDELVDLVEDVVEEKIEDDVYPRLGNIYDCLDESSEDQGDRIPVDLRAELDPEVYDFYEKYTSSFETSMSSIVADLLEENAREMSRDLEDVVPGDPSWFVEGEE